MTFALQMISALAEPFGVIGYLLCGLMLPRLWLALPGACLWALIMQVWETAQAKALHAAPVFALLFPRLSVALIVALAAFLAIEPWRRGRAEAPARVRSSP